MKIKTYQEALQYLSLQLPMFQKKGASALKAGLRNIDDLDEFLVPSASAVSLYPYCRHEW
jgi:hypothetical protein